jgi:hypothetical protein
MATSNAKTPTWAEIIALNLKTINLLAETLQQTNELLAQGDEDRLLMPQRRKDASEYA